MRAFHKQAMTKQQRYENILARRSGTDYSAGIRFQTILFNMYKAKEPTKRNKQGKTNQKQGIRCRCVSSKHFKITSNDCPVGFSYQIAKKSALAMGIYIADKKK